MTDLEAGLTDAERATLDELADAIAGRRLAVAAIFFFESIAPLGFLGSQVMLGLRPMIALVWPDPARWDQLQRVLEGRGAIELVVRRLEARA